MGASLDTQITHWSSPNFHAYYPMANSWPGLLADILSDGFGINGFTWVHLPALYNIITSLFNMKHAFFIITLTYYAQMASPAVTELEVVMMDWLGKLLDLPPVFLACSGGQGGGVIQGTASEAVLVALLAARSKKLLEMKTKDAQLDEKLTASRFIAYSSDQSHSAAERAAMMGGVHVRVLKTDKNFQLRADTLQAAIEEDRANGKIPFFVGFNIL